MDCLSVFDFFVGLALKGLIFLLSYIMPDLYLYFFVMFIFTYTFDVKFNCCKLFFRNKITYLLTYLLTYFYKSFLIRENKRQSTWHLLYKQWFRKCYNVYEDYIKFDKNRQKTEKAHKNSFLKESIENTDLHKPIMSKIMTTRQ